MSKKNNEKSNKKMNEEMIQEEIMKQVEETPVEEEPEENIYDAECEKMLGSINSLQTESEKKGRIQSLKTMSEVAKIMAEKRLSERKAEMERQQAEEKARMEREKFEHERRLAERKAEIERQQAEEKARMEKEKFEHEKACREKELELQQESVKVQKRSGWINAVVSLLGTGLSFVGMGILMDGQNKAELGKRYDGESVTPSLSGTKTAIGGLRNLFPKK